MLQCGNSRCTASVLRVYCECTESLELERGVASAVLGVVEAVLAADCAVCRLRWRVHAVRAAREIPGDIHLKTCHI